MAGYGIKYAIFSINTAAFSLVYKLLGSQSNDIDIALTDMMGYPFAEHLAAFANSRGIETGSISKIAQNPDQSKHLETATLKILGLELDLVNLRSEEYATNSRIPTGVVSVVRYHTDVLFTLSRPSGLHFKTPCDVISL